MIEDTADDVYKGFRFFYFALRDLYPHTFVIFTQK